MSYNITHHAIVQHCYVAELHAPYSDKSSSLYISFQ